MADIYMKSANLLNFTYTDCSYLYILEIWENTDNHYYNWLTLLTWWIQQFTTWNQIRLWLIPRKEEFFMYWILWFDNLTKKNFILKFNSNWNFTRTDLNSSIQNFHNYRFCYKTADNNIVGHTFTINLTDSTIYNDFWLLPWTYDNRIDLEYDATNNKVEYKINWNSFLCWNFLSYTNVTIYSSNYYLTQYARRNSKLEENAWTRWVSTSYVRYYFPIFAYYRIYYQSAPSSSGQFNDKVNKLYYYYNNQSNRLTSNTKQLTINNSYELISSNTNPSNSNYQIGKFQNSSFYRCPTWIIWWADSDTVLEFNSTTSPYWISAYNSWTLIFQYKSNNTQAYLRPMFRLKENPKIFFHCNGKLVYVSDTDNPNFIGWQVWQIQLDLDDVTIESGNTLNTLSITFNNHTQTVSSWTLRYSFNNWTTWSTTNLTNNWATISLSSLDFSHNNTIKLQLLLTPLTNWQAYNFSEFNVLLY